MKFNGTNYAKIIDVRDKNVTAESVFKKKRQMERSHHAIILSFKYFVLAMMKQEVPTLVTNSQQLIHKQINQIDVIVNYNFNFENNNNFLIFLSLYQYGYCQARLCPHRLKNE